MLIFDGVVQFGVWIEGLNRYVYCVLYVMIGKYVFYMF